MGTYVSRSGGGNANTVGGISVSATTISNKQYEVERILMRKYGVDGAARVIDPLVHQISTGRATTDFLRSFVNHDAQDIADALQKGGTTEQVIKRVKRTLGVRG